MQGLSWNRHHDDFDGDFMINPCISSCITLFLHLFQNRTFGILGRVLWWRCHPTNNAKWLEGKSPTGLIIFWSTICPKTSHYLYAESVTPATQYRVMTLIMSLSELHNQNFLAATDADTIIWPIALVIHFC